MADPDNLTRHLDMCKPTAEKCGIVGSSKNYHSKVWTAVRIDRLTLRERINKTAMEVQKHHPRQLLYDRISLTDFVSVRLKII